MKKTALLTSAIFSIGILNGCIAPNDVMTVKTAKVVVKDGEIPKKTQAYWPTKEWRTSLPEQQGMNSRKLADLYDKLDEIDSPLDGLLIIRNGYIVAEKYSTIYGPNDTHEINSVTKSFMGAVTGVAIHDGYIKSVETPVLEYFPERKIANLDEQKKGLTVKDFLTMNSGLDWGELDHNRKEQFWSDFEFAEDTVQFVLDKPTDKNLVGKFDYNTGLPHVLSAIVQKQTGMKTSEYAKEKIFDKIGITSAFWPEAQGVSKGGYRMEMTPRDMARFGYLYLKNGEWNGEQVIPADWVKTSFTEQIPTPFEGGEHYGYYFWISTNKDGYKEISAMGDRGQYIIMVPELNLLVVQTSKAYLTNLDIFADYIYPAVESNKPIPIDKAADERLKKGHL